ncbi:hypothetical protein H4S06_001291 [Coemansia sp. BCRC 34490]|nr:hypothetical protein H4S06_001291 [Coemansia sp. BCRC 34490]
MSKRARVSDVPTYENCKHHTEPLVSCRFVEKRVIKLPPTIGRVGAIAACSAVQTNSDGALGVSFTEPKTPTDDASNTLEDNAQRLRHAVQDPLIAIGTDTGCIALVRTEDTISVLDHGSSNNSDNSNRNTIVSNSGTAAIQRILIANNKTASADTPNTMAPPSTPTNAVPDMVAGDANGQVTVFTLGRLFSRTTFSAPVCALAVDTNPHTPSSYLVGDMGGSVTSYHHTQEVRWRMQLDASSHASEADGLGIYDPQVTGICAVEWADDAGTPTYYVLAATGAQIQVLCHGSLVSSIPLRARCTALCAGTFTTLLEQRSTQAIVGDETGSLYILDRFALTPYAHLAYPVARISALPHHALSGSAGPDIVVCSTLSNFVYLLCAGKIIGTYATDAWPTDVAVIEAVPHGSKHCPVLVVAEADAEPVVARQSCSLLKVVYIEE